jgi:hypothetical protein
MYTLIAAAKFRRVIEYDALSACSGMIWRRDQWFGGCGRGRLIFGWRCQRTAPGPCTFWVRALDHPSVYAFSHSHCFEIYLPHDTSLSHYRKILC